MSLSVDAPSVFTLKSNYQWKNVDSNKNLSSSCTLTTKKFDETILSSYLLAHVIKFVSTLIDFQSKRYFNSLDFHLKQTVVDEFNGQLHFVEYNLFIFVSLSTKNQFRPYNKMTTVQKIFIYLWHDFPLTLPLARFNYNPFLLFLVPWLHTQVTFWSVLFFFYSSITLH